MYCPQTTDFVRLKFMHSRIPSRESIIVQLFNQSFLEYPYRNCVGLQWVSAILIVSGQVFVLVGPPHANRDPPVTYNTRMPAVPCELPDCAFISASRQRLSFSNVQPRFTSLCRFGCDNRAATSSDRNRTMNSPSGSSVRSGPARFVESSPTTLQIPVPARACARAIGMVNLTKD